MEYPFRPNSLYYGDCLEVLEQWPDDCVDLIYLDPPFNSKQNYNVLFREDRQKSGGGVTRKMGVPETAAPKCAPMKTPGSGTRKRSSV